MSTPEKLPVQAAGCVLWRRTPHPTAPLPGGTPLTTPALTGVRPRPPAIEICLIHRPKYDDWSLPKGKLKRGEAPLAAALREVAEETGHTAAPGPELPTARYLAEGRPKQVRYWAAEAVSGAFVPNDEVDRVLWLTPAAARARLTRPGDRTLIDALLADAPLP